MEHELCLPSADLLESGIRYQYACPRTGDRVEFVAEAWNKLLQVAQLGNRR